MSQSRVRIPMGIFGNGVIFQSVPEIEGTGKNTVETKEYRVKENHDCKCTAKLCNKSSEIMIFKQPMTFSVYGKKSLSPLKCARAKCYCTLIFSYKNVFF